ncbi:MAG: deoxynucleoside kinase, partial [Pseudomonadota bacterium]|nr:deoxynucleoside kinase [Pseudomonadota bacterium]
MRTLPHNYIVVEGPIGVGKTHLVKRLADSFSGASILEQPENNPFLEKFYLNPKQSALPTQLSFLMQRVKLSKALQQDDLFTNLQLADFMVEKDRIFANITLDDDELALYNMV